MRLLLAAIVALTFLPISMLSAETIDGLRASDIRVFDGDTIRLKGEHQSLRLIGLNAPESTHRDAKCGAEMIVGKAAKTRLRELTTEGISSVQRVPCSCKPGTEGTDKCNFGRGCAHVGVG